uniref:Uncharacterized protein n=1 Tax=Pipistrellus kuhlii TaxID=59472 RepID=A0A7J7QUP9_PIPKU|nr:hypothetical protein mPipKuh1_008355 [Pipistrellus kuhlii]
MRGFMSLQSAHTRTQTNTHLPRPVRLSGSGSLMVLGIADKPPYVTPRLRDPQGRSGSRVQCNKQKSLFHASMGYVPLMLAAWRKRVNFAQTRGFTRVGGDVTASANPDWAGSNYKMEDNSALPHSRVRSSSFPRPALSFINNNNTNLYYISSQFAIT